MPAEGRQAVWKAVTGFALVFGIYTGATSLWTRISVVPDPSADPSNWRADASFIISNDGNLHLHDVGHSCEYLEIDSTYGTYLKLPTPSPKKLAGWDTLGMITDDLAPAGKQTFSCPPPLVGHLVTHLDCCFKLYLS
jgi:hypothetical protein